VGTGVVSSEAPSAALWAAFAAAPWEAPSVVHEVVPSGVLVAAFVEVFWAACEVESLAAFVEVFVVALGPGHEQGAELERSGLVVGLCIAALVASGRAVASWPVWLPVQPVLFAAPQRWL